MSKSFADASVVAVAVDSGTGRPRHIRVGGERLTVSALEAVRDERAAYPVGLGPRTVFVVRVEGRRYRLVHQTRARRWTLQLLDAGGSGLASAA